MLRLLVVLAVALASSSGCALKGYGQKYDLGPGSREVLDVAYWQGDDFDDKKHRLDIFVPAPAATPSPVLVFVHGGGWRHGDRHELGAYYSRLGRELAARGVLTMVVSYRLAPGFKHPTQVRDVSRALAWTFAHAQDYGGDPARVFAMGHSAGAQLVALAACDPRWLQEVGASPSQLKGVIGISGPYDVEHLGHSIVMGLPMVFPAFGTQAGVWRDASPASHLRDGKPPPFFIAWADGDFEVIRGDATRFVKALQAAGDPVETFETTFDDHFSVITNFGGEGNPLTERAMKFISAR